MEAGSEEAPHSGSSTPQWASDCTACQDIWNLFSDPKSAAAVNLGSFPEALSTSCPAHKPLVQAFRSHVADCEDAETQDVGLVCGADGHSVEMVQSISHGGYVWHLLLVKDASVESHPGTGRILDPDWANLGMLKEWKHDCLALHGKLCDNPMKIWETRPAWLIDVKQRCLVPGQVPDNFVALSYVYGSHRGSHMDADMLARLQQPMALDAPEAAQLLSPIVQHAMYLTGVIGELYLWVDALCIPHHDAEATKQQLEMMAAIYAAAVVTIIAADGTARDGLQGLQGISASRDLGQTIIPFGDGEQLVVRNTGMFSLSGGLPYYDRGWTYQEYKMSPRRILFHSRELHWECSCSVWHEELVRGAEVDKYIDDRMKVILAGFPDLGYLSHIVGNYNKRTLRYEEDALPGITGLLSVLSRSFAGGFLYGLPTMFFDRALGWTPHWSHINLRRRLTSDRSPENRLSPSGLPSWSWTGWQGLVSLVALGEAACINPRYCRVEETTPITTWYTGPSPQTPPSERRRVRSTWFEDRQDYKDLSRSLPPGWTRHDAPATGSFRDEPFLHPDGCDRYIFKHEAMPPPGSDGDVGDEERAWHYPFPVAEIHESVLPPCMLEQTAYLFCDTAGARLWGHQAGDYNMVSLCRSDGVAVGSLHLHNEDSLRRFPGAATKEEAGLPVELVAIYKSRQYSKTWDEQEHRYRLPLTQSDVYCVLWVEWTGGVAYRLASGHVRAEEWDGLEHQSVSLILG
ncbi:hypothetical protein PG985_009859 [Apiospora marii]|uniref:uncharacterized protein n=1 Tax=Apiospora marii TaxID=335849 RepID=UPI0031307601